MRQQHRLSRRDIRDGLKDGEARVSAELSRLGAAYPLRGEAAFPPDWLPKETRGLHSRDILRE